MLTHCRPWTTKGGGTDISYPQICPPICSTGHAISLSERTGKQTCLMSIQALIEIESHFDSTFLDTKPTVIADGPVHDCATSRSIKDCITPQHTDEPPTAVGPGEGIVVLVNHQLIPGITEYVIIGLVYPAYDVMEGGFKRPTPADVGRGPSEVGTDVAAGRGEENRTDGEPLVALQKGHLGHLLDRWCLKNSMRASSGRQLKSTAYSIAGFASPSAI